MKGCIIGSFRKYYDDILTAICIIEKNGHSILSPKKSKIIRNKEGFVILASDNSNYSEIDIETIVLHRLFQSDFIYVWNPNGYVGKTTCYEIGRATEHDIPIYYSNYPKDIPLYIPKGSVINLNDFVTYINKNKRLPPIIDTDNKITFSLLNDLKTGKYHN